MISSGILRYSPKLLGDRISEKWWLVLDCDPEISSYYRHLFHIQNYKSQKLLMPAWDSHVTIIRNEEPPNKELWEAYAGERVEYEYCHDSKTDGNYWWLDVICPRLIEIREELGLSPQPLYPLHLSFGHT